MYAAQMSDIDQERARLRRLLRSKDPTVLNRRPPNGDWSIIENVRHLLFAEQLHLGGFLPGRVQWSPLGLANRARREFAASGSEPTTDIENVFAAWDKVHAPIRRAVLSSAGPDLERALWRNHRHLGIHIGVIEKLLRAAEKPPTRRASKMTQDRGQA